jgi:hypothetical protein
MLDRSLCIIEYLREQGTTVPGVEDSLQEGKVLWERILREGPQILAKVSPMMRAHSSKIRADIASYEQHCTAYKEEVGSSTIKRWITGHVNALSQITSAEEFHVEECETLRKMLHIANVFECLKEMEPSEALMGDVAHILKDFRSLWECVTQCVDVIESAKMITWENLDQEAFDESSKGLVTGTQLPTEIYRPTQSRPTKMYDIALTFSPMHI